MEDEEEIGNVFHFFPKPCVAAIEITSGEIKIGDKIHIKGEHTDFTQTVDSMEIDRVKIESAKAGQSIGIKVKDRVRPHDRVYKPKPADPAAEIEE
jgi:putative protease